MCCNYVYKLTDDGLWQQDPNVCWDKKCNLSCRPYYDFYKREAASKCDSTFEGRCFNSTQLLEDLPKQNLFCKVLPVWMDRIIHRDFIVLIYKSKWFLQVWFWGRCLGLTIVIRNSPMDVRYIPNLWVFVWKRIDIKWRLAICKFSM